MLANLHAAVDRGFDNIQIASPGTARAAFFRALLSMRQTAPDKHTRGGLITPLAHTLLRS